MNITDLYEFYTGGERGSVRKDLRDLTRLELSDLREDAAIYDDLECVAVVDTILAGEHPVYIAGAITSEVRRRLGDSATDADAVAMRRLLADQGHLTRGWLVITSQRWDELASEIPIRDEEEA